MTSPLDFGQNMYYPGSKQKIGELAPPNHDDSPFPYEGKFYLVKGTDTEFFTIGQLALALERKPVTIRKWETDEVIPRATFWAPNPKRDDRARRRLYSRAQAEGIVFIAQEEGIIGTRKPVSKTSFTPRVFDLFERLKNEGK